MSGNKQREPPYLPEPLEPRLNSDDGSVSIEAAFALSSLVIVCGLIIAAMVTVTAYLAALDMAGAAARAHSIGESFEPLRGSVSWEESGGMLTAEARVPAPFGEATAHAVYPVEN
ncbi:hypothetical protein [Corynebacterium deserti]|uniref:hypothetical protein n=1 Tax=Corynebacterium deserti TaxID=1408191 RepID=UPI0009EBE228